MSFCPYCKEIVGSGVTECPSCGMSWAGSENAQDHSAPRIVREEPLAQPPQQQPPQPTYQQPPPPQQPAYQPPPQQYQAPPQYQQPQYQQPPPQPTYQQPPQQAQYQQPPPQQYQPQYQQPPQQYGQPQQYGAPKSGVKAGTGQMILAIIGGIFGILSAFVCFYVSAGGESEITSMFDNLPSDYAYAWLIPIAGVLVGLFAFLGYLMQNKMMGTLAGLSGLILIILPIVWAFHMASDMNASIVDVFFSSESAYGFSYTTVFIGGILAMLGGILAIMGGFGLAKRIGMVRQPVQPQYQQYR